MIQPSTNAASAEVTAIDIQARGPLLLLAGSGICWLVVSAVLAVIASIQLHAPGFLAECSFLTHGRTQAMRETAFIYGWAANAGLAINLWVLGRLGGFPLRALNWVVVGALFWNLGVTAGVIGIGIGDMTSFPALQLPRYVQPLLAVAYAGIAVAGILAWSGRRTERTYASQWYGAAALFLFPWLISAAQVVLLWSPLRGSLQSVAASWYAQSVFSLWLAPLALAGVYYVVPKVSGRALRSYDFAPLGFWTLIVIAGWVGGRHLIGGPVPVWIPTMANAAASLVLFHYLILFLNLRRTHGSGGTSLSFIRWGVAAYILTGVLDAVLSFRGVAERTQFTFFDSAVAQLGYGGGISLMLFGGLYYMVPRLTGTPWASGALVGGHRVLTLIGIVALVAALTTAGMIQGAALLDPQVSFADLMQRVRTPLLIATAATAVLLGASLLLLVNFCRTACCCRCRETQAENPFRQPATLQAHV